MFSLVCSLNRCPHTNKQMCLVSCLFFESMPLLKENVLHGDGDGDGEFKLILKLKSFGH